MDPRMAVGQEALAAMGLEPKDACIDVVNHALPDWPDWPMAMAGEGEEPRGERGGNCGLLFPIADGWSGLCCSSNEDICWC